MSFIYNVAETTVVGVVGFALTAGIQWCGKKISENYLSPTSQKTALVCTGVFAPTLTELTVMCSGLNSHNFALIAGSALASLINGLKIKSEYGNDPEIVKATKSGVLSMGCFTIAKFQYVAATSAFLAPLVFSLYRQPEQNA